MMRLSTPLLFALPFLLQAQTGPIQKETLRAHLAFLADDLLEGRGMGQRGGDLAVRYLETQLRVLGLQPANGTSYLQAVKMLGILPDPKTSQISFSTPKHTLPLELGKDYFLVSLSDQKHVTIDAPFVFVGHGITHKETGRDDFRGVETQGKVLVMLMGHWQEGELPQVCCTPEHYLGRWNAKIEEGRRRGAAAVLIIHTAESARYEWSVVTTGWSSERFILSEDMANRMLAGVIREKAAENLMASVGLDLAQLTRQAKQPGFRPFELKLRAKGKIASKVRHLVQYNVAGILPGTDPRLQEEYVVYSAHWDHFGKLPDGRIFNGAVDNASGCAAGLAIAQAACLKPAPRSQMFLFLTGEEAGLLGSTAYTRAPLKALNQTAAVLNLESLNFLGETKDIAALGADASELGDHARKVAASMGLHFRGSAADPAALFFRADHFAFVRAGVPSFSPGFSLDGGWEYVQDAKNSQSRAEAWLKDGYHKPTDRYDPRWSLDGMIQQTRFIFELGQAVAEAPQKPRWKSGLSGYGAQP